MALFDLATKRVSSSPPRKIYPALSTLSSCVHFCCCLGCVLLFPRETSSEVLNCRGEEFGTLQMGIERRGRPSLGGGSSVCATSLLFFTCFRRCEQTSAIASANTARAQQRTPDPRQIVLSSASPCLILRYIFSLECFFIQRAP